MSNKGIVIAVVVLAGLVTWLVIVRNDERGGGTLADDATAGFAAFLDMNASEVIGIEIARADTKVKATKKGSDWVLDSSYGYPADAEKIDGFLEEVKKIESGRLSGWKEKSHATFEVDKEKGVEITFLGAGSKKLASVVFGKNAQGRTLASKSFVRFADETEVYEVEGNARSRVGGTAELDKDYLLDKDIFKLEDEREIFEATIARADHKVVLERRWVGTPKEKPAEGEGAEENKDAPAEMEWKEEFYVASGSTSFRVEEKEWTVKSFLNNNNLRAEEAVEPKDLKEYGLDNPHLKVALKHRLKGLHTNPEANTNEKVLTVLFGNAIKDDKGEDSKYYAMVEGQERVFGVSKYSYEKYGKDIKDFEPTPEEEPEEGEKVPDPVAPDPGAPGTPEGGVIEPASLDDEPAEESTSSPPSAPESVAVTQVRASHILIPYQGANRAPSDVTRTKDEARTQAVKILADIQKDAGEFEALAKEHSSCPSASKGGDLGSFGRGSMAKPFEESAFGLQTGGISGVVETDFGFHIIKRTK